jgi:molecular chaperone GrpE
LNSEAIERALADFRTWLAELAAVPPPAEMPPTVDLHTLVSQFTALRHEINLQTKAARTSIEQSGETLTELRAAVEELRERPAEEDELTPLLKAIVDVYDNLALALRQVEKQREAITSSLDEWVAAVDLSLIVKRVEAGPPTIWPGFLRRLIGAQWARTFRHPEVETVCQEIVTRHQRAIASAKLVRSSFDGLIAGYSMSLARVDRALEQFNLEPIATVGETFDPELMEVVEVVGDAGKPPGEVLEEVRRGYWRGEVVFRYAQVKVAR